MQSSSEINFPVSIVEVQPYMCITSHQSQEVELMNLVTSYQFACRVTKNSTHRLRLTVERSLALSKQIR